MARWCRLQPCRVSEPSECARLVELAISEFGRIDVLFNLAAKSHFSPLEKFTDEDWEAARLRRGRPRLLPHPRRMAPPKGQPRRGVEHGVPERVPQLQTPALPGAYHQQSRRLSG